MVGFHVGYGVEEIKPALFVGLGFLQYGVGTQLHIIHVHMLEIRDENRRSEYLI